MEIGDWPRAINPRLSLLKRPRIHVDQAQPISVHAVLLDACAPAEAVAIHALAFLVTARLTEALSPKSG